MFKFLEGGMVTIQAGYPAGKIGATDENLAASAEGEHEEWTTLYPGFAKTAKAEGFVKVAEMYEAISKAEAQHERRYKALLDNIKKGKVWKKDKPIKWRCNNCGYVYEGKEPPETCPACNHPRSYYEVLAENW
jgi:rubrerythrin